MLNPNTRVGDFVKVDDKDSPYYGMVGRIIQYNPPYLILDIYGKKVSIEEKALSLVARSGTKSHDRYKEIEDDKSTKRLVKEDYDDLINMAIDIKDWKWARELEERKRAARK